MSTLVLIQYLCDATGCSATIRSSHWTALGAQASANGNANRASWLSLVDDRKRKWHYCPAHHDVATMKDITWPSAHARNLDVGNGWERGGSA